MAKVIFWAAISILTRFEVESTIVKNELVGVNIQPNLNVLKEFSKNSLARCAIECMRRESCLSFSYGNGTCNIYDGRVHPWETKGITKAPGVKYYYSTLNCPPCPAKRPAQEEYQSINGRRVAFTVCPNKLGIYDAMVACSCRGGRLVAIVDAQTQARIVEMLANAGFKKVWFGLSGMAGDKGKPYNMLRSDGQEVTDTSKVYKNWADGNPNCNKEVGATMEKDGKWKDWLPSELHEYICEYL